MSHDSEDRADSGLACEGTASGAARPPESWGEKRAWRVFIAFFLCAAYLSLKGLGAASLWTDEAQDAIIARNLANTGRLTGWDGRNLMAYGNGGTLCDDFRPINPPLGMLCAALSHKILGVSTWSTRVPFVLIGLASFAVFALVLRNGYGTRDAWMWTYGLGLYCFSTWFLLFIRSCRYYAPIFLFTLAAYYGYRRYLDSRKFSHLVLLSVSLALTFHANPMLCVAFLAAVVFTHAVFHARAFTGKDWRNAGMALALFLALTLPYALAYRIWDRPDFAVYAKEPWLPHRVRLLWWNLRDLSLVPFPLPVLPGAAVVFFMFRGKDPAVARMAEWATIGLANLVFIVLLSPQSTVNADMADIRYLIASFPFLWGVAAALLAFIARWNRPASAAVFATLISCNVFSLAPFSPIREYARWRWLLPAYLKEIHRPYPTACETVAAYLNVHAKQDDLAVAYPQYMNYPLMFYLGDKLRFCCLLDATAPLPRARVEALRAPLFLEENYPDWIVDMDLFEGIEPALDRFSKPHLENGRTVRFLYDPPARLAICLRETQRPELPWHSFGPVTDFDPKILGVYVFHKRLAGEQ